MVFGTVVCDVRVVYYLLACGMVCIAMCGSVWSYGVMLCVSLFWFVGV